MTEKTEAVQVTAPMTNAAKLPWPQDVVGITSMLKREGCRAIGRMDGKAERFDLIITTLKVLAGHAKAKIDQQNAVRAVNAETAAKARAAAEEVNRQSAARQEKQLESEIASASRRLKALKARTAAAVAAKGEKAE